MSTKQTDPTIVAAYARSYARAVKARLICYRVDQDHFEVPSVSTPSRTHLVHRTGANWHDWACDCRAAARPACIHRAVAVYAWKHHTGAARPQATAAREEVVRYASAA
jgi:hypothetical protein